MDQNKVNALVAYINEVLAAHGGSMEIASVESGTVSVRLSGGCQGCAGARMTLQIAVEDMFKEHIEGFEKLVDVTDHAAGKNPYFKE